ncbi:MAG: TlpA disulfide reductase family protein [Gammaproteobacteria bacterium]
MLLTARLFITLFLALPLTLSMARAAPVSHSREIDITAQDHSMLSLRQFPAQGHYLAIWIASGYGLSPRDVQLASGLARQGVEVWQIDFAQAMFKVGGSNFLRKLNPNYVVDLIHAARTRTHKHIVLISHSYGAIPALRGATLWQQSHNAGDRVRGVILMSPDLYASIPALGLPPDYLPIVHTTNIPIVIYQSGKRGNAGQFPRLLKALVQSNHSVFFRFMPSVTSPLYPGDTSAPTMRLLRKLPSELHGVIRMLDRLPAPKKVPQYAFRTEQIVPLDSRLKPYRAQPRPRSISLVSADDRHFHIDDYKGKVSVINFWASWCHPCREEIPSLNRLRKKMRGKPFQLISINYAENAKTVKAFLKHEKVDYPVLLDMNGKVSAKWNVIAYPSTFVIGSDGKIHYGVNAAIEWDSPHVIHLLDKLMPQKLSNHAVHENFAAVRQSQTAQPGSNPVTD